VSAALSSVWFVGCVGCGVPTGIWRVLLRAKGFRLDTSGHKPTPYRLQPLSSQNHLAIFRFYGTPHPIPLARPGPVGHGGRRAILVPEELPDRVDV
jgi:hypothetical protein